MSQRQDKRLRREIHRYLRDAGATPAAIRRHWEATLNPRPRWVPAFVWTWLVWLVVKAPPGADAATARMSIEGGAFHRGPR